jgi:DNA-binding response OmpR family regulator
MQKTVLLVEDNTDLLELLVRSLCGRFKIVTATDGLEALRLAGEVSPVLIALDLMLPEMDGFQVCERLRQSPKTCNVPILIMTGLPGEFPRLAGLDCGGTAFITKPFQTAQLVEKVKEMVSLGLPI